MRSDLRLSDLCTFADERVAVADLDLDTYVSTENMLPNKEGITRSAGLPPIKLTQAYQAEDVLVSNIRPYFRKIWMADHDGGCSNDVLVLRAKDNCNPGFLFYLLSDDKFFDFATATAKGTKMPRGDKGAIMCYAAPDLPLDTQIEIADTLSPLDAKVAENRKINHHLASLRSTTDSSPDIRRGKRASRVSTRRAFSARLCRIASNIGATARVNLLTASKLGARIRHFLKSGTVSCCCVVPTPVI